MAVTFCVCIISIVRTLPSQPSTYDRLINVAPLEEIDCLAQGLSSGHLQRIFLENVAHVRGQAATCTPRNPRVTRGIWVVRRDRSVQTSASSGDGPSLGKEVHSAADALPFWRWVNVRAQLTSRLQDLQHRRPPLVSLTESSVSTYDILTRVMNRGEGMLMSVHLVSSEQQYAGRHADGCDRASIPSPLHVTGVRMTDTMSICVRRPCHGILGYI